MQAVEDIKSFKPEPNTLPPSVYILRGLLECEGGLKYVQHACVNDCVRCKPLPCCQWAANKDEQCPGCQERAFNTSRGREPA